LEVGKEYRLSLRFDDESPWVGTFTARMLGDVVVLLNYFDKGNFLKDIAAKRTLTIYYQDREVTTLPLAGSYAAVQALIQCQNAIDARGNAPDPFDINPARRNSDPFSTGGTQTPTSDNDPIQRRVSHTLFM